MNTPKYRARKIPTDDQQALETDSPEFRATTARLGNTHSCSEF